MGSQNRIQDDLYDDEPNFQNICYYLHYLRSPVEAGSQMRSSSRSKKHLQTQASLAGHMSGRCPYMESGGP
ncbi:unnamed protein product [Nezara viridula]|uniref:Uncharacterized protein n=1 Tax=Nezara viridula TaxID=85310 RepID=A0A9P0HQS0_NEZVI|nr:unnamed protein product [Nezara viridula]